MCAFLRAHRRCLSLSARISEVRSQEEIQDGRCKHQLVVLMEMIPVPLFGGERSVIRSYSLREEVICTYHKNEAG